MTESAMLKFEDLRRTAGLTQAEAGDLIGITGRQVQRIEAGEASERRAVMLAMERALLARAVTTGDITIAPVSVRRDALRLAALIQGPAA